MTQRPAQMDSYELMHEEVPEAVVGVPGGHPGVRCGSSGLSRADHTGKMEGWARVGSDWFCDLPPGALAWLPSSCLGDANKWQDGVHQVDPVRWWKGRPRHWNSEKMSWQNATTGYALVRRR